MSENYTWSYENSDGTPMGELAMASVSFPTQAEAESWLGEEWPTLADAGVQAVTLRHGEEVVYGPMSLSPAD